ncbi:hypothetical protein [Streptomyces sp. NPDC048516]|uniref:hypothetical protein n=1 Tax=Streptomyces sp. NPDC048516 TaxID=3365565 RepID=UPI00371BFC7E
MTGPLSATWAQEPETGKWQLVRDRWHTGFVDALGAGGLLGQVEGRAVAEVPCRSF